MKLNNLVRVLLKLLGLYFIVEGVASALSAVVYSALLTADEISYTGWSTFASPASRFTWSVTALALGLYFFLGAQRIVDSIMGDIGPRCAACRYDLSGTSGDQCSECGAKR